MSKESKNLLLVCEGETDIYIFEALTQHFSTSTKQLILNPLAPQKDATSGTYTYPQFGFGNVLNWCDANRDKVQMYLDFLNAKVLLIQLDTDIAQQINTSCIENGGVARDCCQEMLNQKLGTTQEPPHCHYILPTQNTETWILASHDFPSSDQSLQSIDNFEYILDTEQRLIDLKYPSKKGKSASSPRKLNKKPATKYKKYAKTLVNNLTFARQRCPELNRLCCLLEQM